MQISIFFLNFYIFRDLGDFLISGSGSASGPGPGSALDSGFESGSKSGSGSLLCWICKSITFPRIWEGMHAIVKEIF